MRLAASTALLVAPIAGAALVIAALPLEALEEKEKAKAKKKPSKEAVKELSIGIKLLEGGQADEGIRRLRALADAGPEDDPVAKKAQEVLLDHGVGKEVRVVLVDRKVFREKLGFRDPEVLQLAQAAIKAVEPKFKGAIRPFFEERSLTARFYDSEARYRQETGQITSSGCFSPEKVDPEAGSITGKIEWYIPKYTVTVKDRKLRINALLTHEASHYMSHVYLGGAVPGPLEEGIASYLESRLNTEYYQYYRETDRERIESEARQGLQAVAKYPDFIAMLDGSRGFGRGDIMIGRWYGVCYAMVDFFENGEIRSKKASFAMLLEKLAALRDETLGDGKKKTKKAPARLPAKETLTTLVKDFYGAPLEEFHKALVARIIATYKQR